MKDKIHAKWVRICVEHEQVSKKMGSKTGYVKSFSDICG